MMKLTTIERSPQETEIRVEGRIDAGGVGELRRALGACAIPPVVVMNLAGVTSIDAEGRTFLSAARKQGCVLRGASLYIGSLLEGVSS